ncbi:MAG TPA: alpha/beta hydrolase, partial [Kofleriaceae bacterium]
MKLVTFTSTDGTTIGCHVVGRGTPLVLVHGTTADHGRWMPLVSSLEHRFTVYAVDRRGRGASGDASSYALAREVEDVAAVVAGIEGPVDLLGHSFGALVSLEAATRLANLRRLVLYEPPIPTATPLVTPALITRLEALIAAGAREEAVATFLTEGPRVPPNELAVMKSMRAWAARVTAAHTIPRELRASTEYRFDASHFAAVRVPTLLLLGGASPAPFRAALELVRSAIPHAEIAVMPSQQHAAMDTAPDMFLREVLRF